MRLPTLSVAVVVSMFLSSVPASAQTVSAFTVQITNAGQIMSCPATVNFSAALTVNGFGRLQTREVQYKWLNNGGGPDPLTQNVPVPYGSGIGGPPNSFPSTVNITGSFPVSRTGTYWEELQISYPVTQTSPQLSFVVTCPTPGSISIVHEFVPVPR
jgi:hypothetical protein